MPVHFAKDLTAEGLWADRIADNQTATLSTWDYDLLTAEILELEESGFELDLLGFSQQNLNQLIHGDVTDADDVPLPPDEAITQPGDLWILGNHRLLGGDPSKPEDLYRLLDGQVIHLVNVDDSLDREAGRARRACPSVLIACR